MKKFVFAAAIAVPVSVVSPTFADDKSGFYLGLGAGTANFSDAYQDVKKRFNDASRDDDSRTYNFFGGYRFNKYFALETGFMDFGSLEGKGATTKVEENRRGSVVDREYVVSKKKAKSDLNGLNIKAIGFYPINDSFELRGSVGIVRWKIKEKYYFTDSEYGTSTSTFAGHTDTDKRYNDTTVKTASKSKRGNSLTFGLGAQYNLTENISLGLNWDRIQDVGEKKLAIGETDIDTYTASVQYMF